MVQRHSVCVVNKSLSEKVLVHRDPNRPAHPPKVEERTVGVTYRESAMHIPDVQALKCPNISASASIPEFKQTCGKGGGGRWTANGLRDMIGLIQENDLALVSAPVQ